MKWHDGCPFTADDVVWNFARITDQKAPQFYTLQMALSRTYTTNFASVEKIDDHTVAINTKVVESLFPYSDELPADDQPLPGGGAALRLERLCRASVRHRTLPLRPHGRA